MIFDWDNTLIDSWGCIRAAMNRTLDHMGHAPWSLEETKARVARSLRDSFPELFGEGWMEARDVFYQSFEAIHLDHLAPLAGAKELLDAFAGLAVPMGVVSNKNGAFLRKEARHLGWEPLFVRLVGATDAAEDKPSAAPVELVLAAAGLDSAADVWFIGDAAIDVQCALNAGCLPILLTEAAGIPPAENAPKAWKSFRDCRDLSSWLNELVW